MSKKQRYATIHDFAGAHSSGSEVHDGWKPADHKEGISFKVDWEDPFSGFPEHGRRCARALDNQGMPVHLRSLDPSLQWHVNFEVGGQDKVDLKEQYKDLLMRSVQSYLVEVMQTVPSDQSLQQLMSHRFLDPKHLRTLNKFRILSTVWERDRVSEHAAMALNMAAQCWVATPHDVEMLVKSGVDRDRLRVVPVPHFPNDQHLALRGRKRIPGPVRFYHIGKWEPRKAHNEMLGSFMMAIKPGEAKLYFKTSSTAPKFVDYPLSPEESLHRWMEDDRVKANGWNIEEAQKNIFLIKRRIPPKQILALHRMGDIYLSLSRGEGFDMPAYDAKLAGNMLVYTPSGGPQSFASTDDVCVPVLDSSVPCHPFYRWGNAEYKDWSLSDSAACIHRAYQHVLGSKWDNSGHDMSAFSAETVGAGMRKNIEEVLEKAFLESHVPSVESSSVQTLVKPDDFAIVVQTVPSREKALHETIASIKESGVFSKDIIIVTQRPDQDKQSNLIAALTKLSSSDKKWGIRFEDDILVNKHILHNLCNWDALSEDDFGAGWLYHSGILSTSGDLLVMSKRGNTFRDHSDLVGSLGVVLKTSQIPELIDGVRKHWNEVSGAQDKSMSRTIWNLGRRVYVHCPPLVEHNIAHVSTLAPSRSVDFMMHTTGGKFDAQWMQSVKR